MTHIDGSNSKTHLLFLLVQLLHHTLRYRPYVKVPMCRVAIRGGNMPGLAPEGCLAQRPRVLDLDGQAARGWVYGRLAALQNPAQNVVEEKCAGVGWKC